MYKINLLALSFLVSGCMAAPKVELQEEEITTAETTQDSTKQGSNLIMLASEAQLNDIIASGKLILVDFFATWCGPCKRFLETLEKIAPEFPNVMFVKVNVNEFKALATKYNVSSIPSIKILSNGNETPIDQFTGFKSAAELRKFLKKLGA